MPFVYIVRCADGTLYTGWALDVAERVKRTVGRLPLVAKGFYRQVYESVLD